MEEIELGSKYQHFKGNIVEVLLIAKNSETLEDMVVYNHDGEVWVRPISMFLSDEDVSERPDNKTGQKRRFEKIEER